MKIAVVHDWLPVFGGAEQVLAEIIRTVGPTDLYTLFDFLCAEDRVKLGAREIFTSYLNKLPSCEKYYRWTFPICPAAIESFDLSRYDLVVSSSAAFAKGVIVHPHQRHIAYVHTSVRYAWDQTYEYASATTLSRPPFGILLQLILHRLRIWDTRTAHSADVLLANSSTVKRRIEQVYGRNAIILPPPVDIESFPLCTDKENYFVVVSRLVPYKRIDLVIEAFAQMPGLRLVVVGDGPEICRLKSRAGQNVAFTGHVGRADLVEIVRRARAFVFAAYEDFGIAMVEAQAAGTPVIAFHRGGSRDIVVTSEHGPPTGVLFNGQNAAAVKDAIERFCATSKTFSPQSCRANAERFSAANFRLNLSKIINEVLDPDFCRGGLSDLKSFRDGAVLQIPTTPAMAPDGHRQVLTCGEPST
jgi:glycosyltransferase involved in cell wall biosynthesis